MRELSSALTSLVAISLPDLDAQWNSTSRFDAKFILTQSQVADLIESFGDDVRILTINEKTHFDYLTEYLDTSTRKMYRHHVQGKSRRQKVRKRTYVDVGKSQFEVKERLGTAETRKTIVSQLSEVQNYQELQPSALTRFNRITLFRPQCQEKITIDFNLHLTVLNQSISAKPEMVLVEVKSINSRFESVRELRMRGVRPSNFSKYSCAIDLLASPRPRVHTRRLLAKMFDLENTVNHSL